MRSAALPQAISEWRQAHPSAMLDEIEGGMDAPVAPVRAKWVEAKVRQGAPR